MILVTWPRCFGWLSWFKCNCCLFWCDHRWHYSVSLVKTIKEAATTAQTVCQSTSQLIDQLWGAVCLCIVALLQSEWWGSLLGLPVMSEGNHSSHVTLVFFTVADHGLKCGKQPRGVVGNLGKTGLCRDFSFFFFSSLFLVVFNAVYLIACFSFWKLDSNLCFDSECDVKEGVDDFSSSSGVFVTSDVCRLIA